MKLKVLVAEGDEEFAEVVCTYLRAQACEVRVTYTGVECLEQVGRFNPRVIVLDGELLWGGASGVLACLRESNLGYCPAVVLTAWSLNEQFLARSAPIVDCLVKPFALASLMLSIETAAKSSENHGMR
jgi:DNA-binding response OmpR family regulator